uniref:hypothetical protein n=1 Tax=Neisseria mucosa TaxID=488 RepID=UPI0027DEE843
LSGICEPYCLITPDLTMRYCPILILIDYIKEKSSENMEDKFSDDLIKANYLTVIPVHTE